jgi:hypothetical protein
MNSAARRRNVNNTASSGRAPTLPPEQMRVLKAKVRELDRKFLENTDRKLKDLGVSKEQRTEIRVVNQAFFTEDPEEALARTAQCGESPPQQTVLHRALKLSYGGTKIAIRGFKGLGSLSKKTILCILKLAKFAWRNWDKIATIYAACKLLLPPEQVAYVESLFLSIFTAILTNTRLQNASILTAVTYLRYIPSDLYRTGLAHVQNINRLIRRELKNFVNGLEMGSVKVFYH